MCCQQCAAVSACFFGSVAQLVCKLLCSSDAVDYQAACTLFFCSALGVYTRFYGLFAAVLRRVKPERSGRRRALVHVCLQPSGAVNCAGRVVLARPAMVKHSSTTSHHNIGNFASDAPCCNDTALSARQYNV